MIIKGILFDKDDTLIKLDKFWRKPCKLTISQMLECCGINNNEKLSNDLLIASGFNDTGIISGSPIQKGTNTDVVSSWVNVLNNNNIKVSKKLFDTVMICFESNLIKYGEAEPFCDIKNILKKLKIQGIKLGVATSDSKIPTLYCLNKLHITELFDCIVTSDCVKNPKPHRDSLDYFCINCDLTPEEILMIGDSENDMVFAKSNHAHGILFNPNSDLTLNTVADNVIDNLDCLGDIDDIEKLISVTI